MAFILFPHPAITLTLVNQGKQSALRTPSPAERAGLLPMGESFDSHPVFAVKTSRDALNGTGGRLPHDIFQSVGACEGMIIAT